MERLPKRNEVPVELTWRLSDIYPSTDAWEKDFKESLDLAEKIAGFEGRAAADAKSLLAVMDLYEACMIKFYAVIHYANFLHDEDTADQAHQVLIQRAQSVGVQISLQFHLHRCIRQDLPGNSTRHFRRQSLA